MWIVTTLLKIINNSELKSIEYQIALKILENTNRIGEMSVQDLADACHVSVSTIKKFLKMFGFYNFTFFKTLYVNHVDMRKTQLTYRLNEIDSEKENQILKAFLNEQDYQIVTNKQQIDEIVSMIHNTKRIVLLGSEEMKTLCLRFQGDLTIYGKLVVDQTLYEDLFENLKEEDMVFVFTMTGRTFVMNKAVINNLDKHLNRTIVVGSINCLEADHLLYIPKDIPCYFQDMVLNYYLERITEKFMGDENAIR